MSIDIWCAGVDIWCDVWYFLFRKKHGCKTKEQLEMVIGYNRPTADEPTADEPAATSPVATETEPAEPAAAAAAAGASSPEGDTVCKYCGRDFEFARALKHHVRSHSSCRSKPYVCVPCGHGFSTRANCTRHVHRQHAHLPPNNLHRHIRLNATRTPPPAPYTGTYITSPPTVKCDVAAAADDDDDSDDDEPLDFSMKGGVSQAAAATAVRGRDQWESSSDEDEDDEPMDLSLHGQRASESVGVAAGQVGGQVVGQVGGQAAGQVSRQVAGQVGGQAGRQAAGQVGGQAARQAVGQVARPVAIKAAGQAAGQAGREAAGQAGRQAAGPATNVSVHTSLPLSYLPLLPGQAFMFPQPLVSMASLTHGVTGVGPGVARLALPADFHCRAAAAAAAFRYDEVTPFRDPRFGGLRCPFCNAVFQHGLKVLS